MVRPTILQIKQIYYPFLAAFGVPANLLTILILARGNCSLSKCISAYMVAMAAADLMVMIFNIILYNICTYNFPHSFLSYTAVCKFTIYFNSTSLHMSVWFTTLFTFDRFVAICCQRFKTKYCTVRNAAVVITTVSVLLSLQNLPYFFAFQSAQIINNIDWGCQPRQDFFSSLVGVGFSWLQSILSNWIPFSLILLFNCLTVRRIVVASRARRALRGHSSENQSDPEMESRRNSIILLFSVSGSYIVLWLTPIVSFLTTGLTDRARYRGDYVDPKYIATETGYMLMYLSSCANTCIYAATQTKFRDEIKMIVKSVWTFREYLQMMRNYGMEWQIWHCTERSLHIESRLSTSGNLEGINYVYSMDECNADIERVLQMKELCTQELIYFSHYRKRRTLDDGKCVQLDLLM
ncbi:probable G-protein coupled receptor 139 [Heterodontus francisci]|uniref:probable G-protein coupled receptor 139 n=1 Tax=Heterodontus francisci TaxID=7792 RepID=UPI00355C1C03